MITIKKQFQKSTIVQFNNTSDYQKLPLLIMTPHKKQCLEKNYLFRERKKGLNVLLETRSLPTPDFFSPNLL